MPSSYHYLTLPNYKNYFHAHRSQLKKTDYKPYTKTKIFKDNDFSKKQVLENTAWNDLV